MKTLIKIMIDDINRSTRGNSLRLFLGRLIRQFFPNFRYSETYGFSFDSIIRISVLGKPFYVDPEDGGVGEFLLNNAIYEADETKLLSILLKPGMTFIDIGANIGYFTVLAAKAVLKEGLVIAFEPDPHNVKLLMKNIKVNKLKNVTIVNKAVSDKPGHVRLFLSEVNSGDHRIYDGKDDEYFNAGMPRREIKVETTTLEEYLCGNSRTADVIKMDIQGAEYAALQGMKRTLNQNPAIVLFAEFWPYGIKSCGHDPVCFLMDLFDLDFRIYAHKDRLSASFKHTTHYEWDGPFKEHTSIKEFLETLSEVRWTNLVCSRRKLELGSNFQELIRA